VSDAQRRKESFQAWMIQHRWLITVVLLAFAIRLHWNLIAHPIDQFMYSDMRGYNKRANAVLSAPLKFTEYTVFFPYGTTWMLAALKLIFGHENFTIIAIWYAALGAGVVGNVSAVAGRISKTKWLAPTVGGILAVYYPIISIGGYILSEIPFAFCLTSCLYLLVRLHDEGRERDAWILGILAGIGMAIRPQILMSVGLFGLYWLVARKHMPRITWGILGRVAIPLLIILGISSFRLYLHTGRVGLVSENGTINQVFGRCHNKGLYARPSPGRPGTIRFAPPPLIQLEAHTSMNPDSWIRLDPVFAIDDSPIEGVDGYAIDEFGCTKRTCRIPGGELEYRGYIGDQKLQRTIVKECIRRSGWAKQAYFSFVHIVQLWGYNSMWPDQADPKPRPTEPVQSWRALAEGWRRAALVFCLPALLGLGWLVRPAIDPRRSMVALQLLALLAVAAIYIGGVRFRIPYDPIIILLALMVVESLVERWRAGRNAPAS
jgi:hypothetical protein